jgi:uncharacterized protein YaeQ
MALKSTIFKIELQVSDIDRGYYATHELTLARHPSETDERLMVRLLSFALNAHEQLSFGRGLSADDEPDLWQRDLTGAIQKWIITGLPEARLIRRACGRADQVIVYCYGRNAALWWTQNHDELKKNQNLKVIQIDSIATAALAGMAQRSMALSVLIQDQLTTVSSETVNLEVALSELQSPQPTEHHR